MKRITLNEGSQKDFVNNQFRYSAYIGGLGSGKTFAGLARGLKFSQQPKPPGQSVGPRGLAAAISYPVLRDVVLPEFFQMVEGTGLLKEWKRSEMKAIMTNGAEILFRSLDEPNRLRGLQLSWFFIDEGRHITRAAWDVLVGRLRQPGFQHAGWVCSTPHGYDWMWSLFHSDSPIRLDSAHWFGASTYANKRHLPAEYIADLEKSYSGKFFQQEVLGEFVGLMHGSVFPEWDSQFLVPVAYDPELPLYSFWDFGIGDIGVVLFAQLTHQKVKLPTGDEAFVPQLRFLDAIEASDWNARQWADEWKLWLHNNTRGRRPTKNFGDPAGKARSQASGTSVIDDLLSFGVPVTPAQKRPPDYGIRILRNLMEGSRVIADYQKCSRLGAAFATHRWPTDSDGNRIGTQPVHDWTSHYASAARYGVTGLLSFFPRRTEKPAEPIQPGTVGDVIKHLTASPSEWLGGSVEKAIPWRPQPVGTPDA